MAVKYGTNKIGKVYYGANKIGKIYYGSNLVYQSSNVKQIPGHIYWDGRAQLNITATYRFYNRYMEVLYEGTNPISQTVMDNAYYYENLSGNTRACFACYSNDTSIAPVTFVAAWSGMSIDTGPLIGATNKNGFTASILNGAILQDYIDNVSPSLSVYSILYKVFQEMNKQTKPYGCNQWTIAAYDDVMALANKTSENIAFMEYDSQQVQCCYYDSNKWKIRQRNKYDDTKYYIVAHFY